MKLKPWCRQTAILTALGLLALGTMAVDCVGPPGEVEWEPEPIEEACRSDADCADMGFSDAVICAWGACVDNSGGFYCDDNAACAPFVCDPFTRECVECGEWDGFGEEPVCDPGQLCLDGQCTLQASPLDFALDIEPLFEAAACSVCHRPGGQGTPSDLDFTLPSSDLYAQILRPDLSRVDRANPAQSTIITKPQREDPPNHPVGTWASDGPEVELLIQWIEAGALEEGLCRRVDGVDCFRLLDADTLCSTVVEHGVGIVDRCGECDPQFQSIPGGQALSSCFSDGGPAPVPDAGPGPAPDAGPAPAADAGLPITPDAGPGPAPDAG